MQYEESIFLNLRIGTSHYIFPITDVQEVSEMPLLRAYPLIFTGHRGVVNLRGVVIPVIAVKNAPIPKESEKGSRLVVAKKDNQLFGFVASSVRKVVLNDTQMAELSSSGVTKIDDRPTPLLSLAEVFDRGAA